MARNNTLTLWMAFLAAVVSAFILGWNCAEWRHEAREQERQTQPRE